MLFCWLGQTPDKTSINQISFSEDHLYFKYLLNLFTNNLINLKHYYAEILCLVLLLDCFPRIHRHYHLLRNFPYFFIIYCLFISQTLRILSQILLAKDLCNFSFYLQNPSYLNSLYFRLRSYLFFKFKFQIIYN